MSPYVLITPAKNEEKVIVKTLESMLGQTRKPLRWIIVDDGSTDRTYDIAQSYAARHNFIAVVSADGHRSATRNFGRKVHAFNKGLQAAQNLPYEYVGNLDADILLPADYYERILEEFARDARLGIAGGVLYTQARQRFVCDDTSLDSIGGAIQLFRRRCFEEIGGYAPLETGGIDTAAEVSARMKGWTVRKITEQKVYEQRSTGSVGQRSIVARFREGIRCHALGYSALFYLMRCVYKSTSNRPFVVGSIASFAGFIWSRLCGHPVRLPQATVEYLRSEQLRKLKKLITKRDRSFLVSRDVRVSPSTRMTVDR
jgi:glycosyltransferase involved in cell wall biosynthesis